MQLTKDKVATLHYKLTDDEGNTIDQSDQGGFAYLHGQENIIPGLESALEGKEAGDDVKVVLEPEEAYGERNLENVHKVPRNLFPPDMQITPGMRFRAQASDGQSTVVTVMQVQEEEVLVDGNHPLAGKRLHFEVSIADVREASPEELDNGQAEAAGASH